MICLFLYWGETSSWEDTRPFIAALRQRKGGRKTYRGSESSGERESWERMIESERKNREDRKREGNAAPLLLPQHHLRGREQRPARSFLIICSICADPTLFSLNISQRKRFKLNTTCPPFPYGRAWISWRHSEVSHICICPRQQQMKLWGQQNSLIKQSCLDKDDSYPETEKAERLKTHRVPRVHYNSLKVVCRWKLECWLFLPEKL